MDNNCIAIYFRYGPNNSGYIFNINKIKTTDSFNCGWELIKFFSRTTHEKAPLARGFIKTTSVINFVVCMSVCVFACIHLEGFICLGLEAQGTDQRCCVEDVIFLCQVPSTILQYESPSLSN